MLNVNRLRRHNLDRSLVAQVASAIVILVGIVVLFGWFFDIQFIKQAGFTNLVTMKANTALCFLLAGLSLWLTQKGQTKIFKESDTENFHNTYVADLRFSRVCAIAVTLIGLLTLMQYLFGWNFGIDELLFPDEPNALFTSHPGRMGFNTALNFMLVGRALELLAYPKTYRSYWYAQILTLIAALISLQVLIGYAYKVQLFSRIASQTTAMALTTAVGFIVLCVGILWVRPDKGFMRVVISDTYGGLIARRLLIATISIPLVLGWLILQGQIAGQYGSAFAISLFAIFLITIFAIFVWHSSAVIERLCRQQDEAQKNSELMKKN